MPQSQKDSLARVCYKRRLEYGKIVTFRGIRENLTRYVTQKNLSLLFLSLFPFLAVELNGLIIKTLIIGT